MCEWGMQRKCDEIPKTYVDTPHDAVLNQYSCRAFRADVPASKTNGAAVVVVKAHFDAID